MAEIKTKPTGATVDSFIDAVPSEERREDAKKVRAMMERLSGRPAAMWGPSIIGFGTYHYKYDSGHEGTACRIGFSPRKTCRYCLIAMADVAEASTMNESPIQNEMPRSTT